MNKQDRSSVLLAAYSANTAQTEELLAYNENVFAHNSLALALTFDYSNI